MATTGRWWWVGVVESLGIGRGDRALPLPLLLHTLTSWSWRGLGTPGREREEKRRVRRVRDGGGKVGEVREVERGRNRDVNLHTTNSQRGLLSLGHSPPPSSGGHQP